MGTRFSLATEPLLAAPHIEAFKAVFGDDNAPDDYGCFFSSWKDMSYDGGLDIAIGSLADVARRLPTTDKRWTSVAILSDEGPPICVAITYGNIKLLLGTPENAEHVAAYRKHCCNRTARGEPLLAPEPAGEIKIPLAE